MYCNGICPFCTFPCKKEVVINPRTEEATDKVSVQDGSNLPTAVENIGTFEVVKSVFGKEKVRKVK